MSNEMIIPHPPMFDPSGPNLSAEKKLFNVKKKIGEIKRFLKNEETHAVEEDALSIIHHMLVVLAEVEREVDRTV